MDESVIRQLQESLPDIETCILLDDFYGISGEMDWGYYDYNGADITITQAYGDWQVFRTFGVGAYESCIYTNDKGEEITIHYSDVKEYIEENHLDEEKFFSEVEYTYDFEEYGEFKQVFLNVKTGELFQALHLNPYDYSSYDDWHISKIEKCSDEKFPTFFYHVQSLHDILKRNGIERCECESIDYGSDEYNYDAWSFHMAIVSRDYEYILKTIGESYAMDILHDEHALKEMAAAIRICQRNKYKMPDVASWFDMVKAMIQMNVDVHNRFYVCPENFVNMHDIMIKRFEKIRAKMKIEEQKKQAAQHESQFKEIKGKYLHIEFGNDKYYVRPLQSVVEHVEEGQQMKHCVGTMGYWKKTNSIILTVRDGSGNRVTTCELSLADYTIKQNFAACNQIHEDDDAIRKLILDNVHLFKRATMGVQSEQPTLQPVQLAA